MNKIEALVKVFSSKEMEKYGGLRIRLNNREMIIVRSYFCNGLKPVNVYNSCVSQL